MLFAMDSASSFNQLRDDMFKANKHWWNDVDLNDYHFRGLKLALIMTEAAEAFEAFRTGKPDNHIPEFSGEAAELADVLLRVFDYCGAYNIDIQGAFLAKMKYNQTRQDHTPKMRAQKHGKKF